MNARYPMREILGATLLACALPAVAMPASTVAREQGNDTDIRFRLGDASVSVRLEAAGIVHVQALPDGVTETHTLVLDPYAAPSDYHGGRMHADGDTVSLCSDRLCAVWHKRDGLLDVTDANHHRMLQLHLDALTHQHVRLDHASDDTLYGIGGYTTHQSVGDGLVRTGKQVAKAGEQGHAGAPFVWSTAGYGVLVDSDGATFTLKPGQIDVGDLSKRSVDVYLLVGDPKQVFASLADLSGHAPMFPKWSMGFINSQWGIDEAEFRKIIATYRGKHIPLDVFTFDFDWKAWGKDWGEFRWNAEKFPDGPTGKLKADMDKLGVHMTGIMKPRVHVNTVEGHYATAHHLWRPDEKVSDDYFSHKPVKNIDFDKPAARAWWFNKALTHSFDTGIVGWWNDEADTTDSNTQFLNMQRATFDGQRAHSPLRVWSINRNFWLGSQRYAYGLWSGDIDTGFKSMAMQRTRMLSAIEAGEMWWGMDGGGFNGHPSDENYARWIEFGAFTPIFRVHGTFGEKRQPWVYGPMAEKAATQAIRLRYRLMPYIYSYAHHATVAGVGLVRPLSFGWPDDAKVRNDVDAWMFGQWLLVSPVVKEGQTSKRIYLPAGTWTNWFTGKTYRGGQTVTVAVDSKTWADIPLFIRAGAIIPTQPVMDYIGQHPVTTVSVDVFPSATATHFDYYDDAGDTYAYAHGAYYLQRLQTQHKGGEVCFHVAAPQGDYRPALRDYLVKVHGVAAAAVSGVAHHYADLDALEKSDDEGWATGHDRFGPVTWIRVSAGHAKTLVMH
ncbi:MAG TPA: TIM-barrel domain-containing protein [Rhodanobacteraceae bacterium]|nr:TIM-barrel domain-containing protein [Rhodanobacteraceae bacterium]